MMHDCETATCESYRAFGPVTEAAPSVEDAKQQGYCHVCIADLAAHLDRTATAK